ncbi:MAG: hypothetical protein HY244_07885, partial [Rhizobiales bacterium]|nr:hypothetical protein [Hyphomicrobiales bacterium]
MAQLIPARAMALLVAATLLLGAAVQARAQAASGACNDAAELAVLSSPTAPWQGAPLRVVFAAEKQLDGELTLIAPDG